MSNKREEEHVRTLRRRSFGKDKYIERSFTIRGLI
jgi:hypothetical protein